MSVAVNSVRKAVEISWETGNAPVDPPPDKPEGFPEHPIYLPPYVDNSLPGDQPHVDHELPGDQPHVDHELPKPEEPVDPDYGIDEGAHPSHPIYLPPYIDNSLPGPQPRPEHPIVLPPDLIEGVPGEKLEAILSFLFGNLPEYEGRPQPTPVSQSKHGVVEAVQVFAQGQNGDWSNTPVMKNDGLAVLTYPDDFEGESYVEVRDLYGNLIDAGTIQVEAN